MFGVIDVVSNVTINIIYSFNRWTLFLKMHNTLKYFDVKLHFGKNTEGTRLIIQLNTIDNNSQIHYLLKKSADSVLKEN